MNLNIRGEKKKHKSFGQSIVEFTLMLPVLLIMISGLIEMGFMLNFYLDLIDTAREVARLAADDDPIHDEAGFFNDDPRNDPEPKGFYLRAYDARCTLSCREQGKLHSSKLTMMIWFFPSSVYRVG
jgi:hypothetical protein